MAQDLPMIIKSEFVATQKENKNIKKEINQRAMLGGHGTGESDGDHRWEAREKPGANLRT